LIRLASVSVRFGDLVALDGVDLAVEEGETTVLIGPSGCGKSTLLRVVVGLVEPAAGDVRVEGEPVTPASLLSLRRRMGYVIQEGGLFPHLSARRNITLMARHLRWPEGRREERLEELRELTHFPRDGLDRYPGELSGGQQQRVGLMRALMLDPRVLLLDEPLGALDPLVRRGLQDELREIFGRLNKTVLLVTHDLAEAAWLAHRIVLMREGRVVQEGTLADLKERPAHPFVPDFMAAQRSPVEI